MGPHELDVARDKALECDRTARLYFGILRSAAAAADATRFERAREYGDYLFGLAIKTRKAVERVRQHLLFACAGKRRYRSCRTPHPPSAHLYVHLLAHDAVVAWSESLAAILRNSWFATERDPATFSDGMRELQADLAALGEPDWTPADLEIEWAAARRLNGIVDDRPAGNAPPSMLVSLDPPQITINGTTYALTLEQARYLQAVIDRKGWLSDPEFRRKNGHCRPARWRKMLPPEVRKHLDTAPRKGTRWRST